MRVLPSHVALLVKSVERAAAVLRPLGFPIGKTEIWEGEGTREIYVGNGQANALLLMEPIADGAYRRALAKRGAGVHHLAVDVLDLDAYIVSLGSSGWLLHPKSVETMKRTRTAWLARPGFPSLIEVQEREVLTERPLFVTGIEMENLPSRPSLLASIGLDEIVKPSRDRAALTLLGQRVGLADLL